jgi:O-glycosyl hydrolase
LGQSISDDTEVALFMAERIIDDLRDLKAEAWVDWQSGDPSRSWASFTLNNAEQSHSPLKRFYMHAGFSRYIRPGATFIDVDNSNMVAAVSADGHSLTVVVRNGSPNAAQEYTFDLTSLPTVGAVASVHRTSRTEDLEAQPDVSIQDYSLVVEVPAYSVTTFVISMP